MPAKKAHLLTAIITGFITGFIVYNNLIYALAFTALAGITSDIPDRIERPTNSMHRKFYHSITLFIILIYSLVSTISSPLSGLIYGYTSHLMLDYARTRHKPLI